MGISFIISTFLDPFHHKLVVIADLPVLNKCCQFFKEITSKSRLHFTNSKTQSEFFY